VFRIRIQLARRIRIPDPDLGRPQLAPKKEISCLKSLNDLCRDLGMTGFGSKNFSIINLVKNFDMMNIGLDPIRRYLATG
jgi:hypothetical protein